MGLGVGFLELEGVKVFLELGFKVIEGGGEVLFSGFECEVSFMGYLGFGF